MDQHFQTDYSEYDGFAEKLKVSDKIVRQFYVPAIKEAGFGLSPLSADTEAFQFSDVQLPFWIDQMSARKKIVRTPDLASHGNPFVNIIGSDCKSVYFEIKDYAQMNCFLSTGIPYWLVYRYIAWQHLTGFPVIPLFKDSAQQETGERPGKRPYKAYRSAFRNGDRFIPYGGLLFDLELASGCSYNERQTNEKLEICWKVQRDYDGSIPVMKTIYQIADLLASGKVKKIKGDPNGLPMWIFIQKKAEQLGLPKLIEPKGGLVYFKTENA